MLNRIQEFVQVLRQNGLRISPAEVTDAAQAGALADLGDRASFRAAMAATLCKRAADRPAFDRVFEIYFGEVGRLVEGLEASLLARLAEEGLDGEELDKIARALAELAQSQSPLARALLEGSAAEVMKLLRGAAVGMDLGNLIGPMAGFYARRLLAGAGGGSLGDEMRGLTEELARRGLSGAASTSVNQELARLMRELEQAARRYIDRERRARDKELRGRLESALEQKSLASLTPSEVQALRAAVRKLAEKLKSKLSRRRARRRKGALNVRRTLRKNLSSGGWPAALVFRSRRRERPEVVILCDVSDSVRNVSRLMLQFVYSLQDIYSRVRSFAFVSEIGEATDLFKKMEIDDAVEAATSGRVVDVASNSNYGRALTQFHKNHWASLTRRTTVIVIGDGRTNYNPPQAWVLDEIRKKARRLIWLCSEEQGAWGFGDSEMVLYARKSDQTFTVRTLDDLARAAEKVMP